MMANHTHLVLVQSSKKRGSCEQLAPDILFQATKTQKRNLIQYCTNKTRVGVEFFDQMTRICLVKAASRRWPVHLFCNVVEMVLINSSILYKQVCQSSISRTEFIQRVAEELTGSTSSVFRKRRAEEVCSSNDTNASSIVKRHLTWSASKCRNWTTEMCQACNKPVYRR